MTDDDEIPCEEQRGFERITLKSIIFYNEICLFEVAGEIILHKKNIYNLSIFIGLMANKMYPANKVFDTGREPNIPRKDLLKAEWLRAIPQGYQWL